MLEIARAKTDAAPLQDQLIQMALAHWASRVLYVAAEMNLADRLAEGPRTAEELAQSTLSDAPSLYRVMRTLASLGLFTEGPTHRFSLTLLGEAFRTPTIRASVLTVAGDLITKSLEQLPYSIQTGKSGFEKAFGVPFFEYLATHPADASMFSETMVGLHGSEPDAVAAAYDFSQFETITDVGGATGNLLATILSRRPEPRGMLFDLQHVVRDAPPLIEAHGLADRITIEAGDFFESIPAGAGAYLLSHIVHDWSEAQCLVILGNCRRAMKPNSRLLIIETVLAPGDTPHLGKMLDMIMLALFTGAQERTEPEYRCLLDRAGFRLERIVPTKSAVSIVEAFLA